MPSNRRSFRLCCFACAILGALLWMLMSNLAFTTAFAAEEKTDNSKPKPAAEAKSNEADRYQIRQEHDPEGTGKFYMGREIAFVMGFPAATWLEREEREEEERLTLLVKSLKLKPGMVVADIGAGSGVISMMMAKVVGKTGKVVAVDIQQEMLQLLSDKIKDRNIKNIELVLGADKSPKLEADTIDLAIMVDVYHEFEFPYETMLELSKAIKPGGRVAFVEYRKEDPDVPIKLVHKMTEKQIKAEIGQPEFGLQWKETVRTLPRQHIVIFERTKK